MRRAQISREKKELQKIFFSWPREGNLALAKRKLFNYPLLNFSLEKKEKRVEVTTEKNFIFRQDKKTEGPEIVQNVVPVYSVLPTFLAEFSSFFVLPKLQTIPPP